MRPIVVVGTTILDQILELKQPFDPHRCNKATMVVRDGGSMRNVAENCARLNLSVDFISKFGNDTAASDMIARLQSLNVRVYGPTLDGPTPVFLEVDGDTSFKFATTTSDFLLSVNDAIPTTILGNHAYGITDSCDPQFLSYLLKHGSSTRWIISSYLPEKRFFKQIEGVILNEHELASHLEGLSLETLALSLHHSGLNWLIVTLQDKGSCLLHNSKAVYFSTIKKEGRTLGCGDAFASGIVFGLIQKWNWEKTIAFASKIAAAAVSPKHRPK